MTGKPQSEKNIVMRLLAACIGDKYVSVAASISTSHVVRLTDPMHYSSAHYFWKSAIQSRGMATPASTDGWEDDRELTAAGEAGLRKRAAALSGKPQQRAALP